MTKNALALSFFVVAILPLTARANSLRTGVLNFGGAANISLGSLGFQDNMFTITSPGSTQQGGFVALSGTTGTIVNLADPPYATGPLNIPDFITFAADPAISITLTYLYPGIEGAAGCLDDPPAAGQVCTPNLPDQSPVNLQNLSPTSAFASVNVAGFEVDSGTGDTIPVVGTFSAPFASENFQEILAIIFGGGTVTTAFSAQFSTVAIPEPGTWIELMIGIGAVGMGLVYRKRFGQA